MGGRRVWGFQPRLACFEIPTRAGCPWAPQARGTREPASGVMVRCGRYGNGRVGISGYGRLAFTKNRVKLQRSRVSDLQRTRAVHIGRLLSCRCDLHLACFVQCTDPTGGSSAFRARIRSAFDDGWIKRSCRFAWQCCCRRATWHGARVPARQQGFVQALQRQPSRYSHV